MSVTRLPSRLRPGDRPALDSAAVWLDALRAVPGAHPGEATPPAPTPPPTRELPVVDSPRMWEGSAARYRRRSRPRIRPYLLRPVGCCRAAGDPVRHPCPPQGTAVPAVPAPEPAPAGPAPEPSDGPAAAPGLLSRVLAGLRALPGGGPPSPTVREPGCTPLLRLIDAQQAPTAQIPVVAAGAVAS